METVNLVLFDTLETVEITISEIKEEVTISVHESQNGLTAYQLAVNHGFEGSEEEWLISLVGSDGYIPPKSTYSELNTGTDDIKYITPLALSSSLYRRIYIQSNTPITPIEGDLWINTTLLIAINSFHVYLDGSWQSISNI